MTDIRKYFKKAPSSSTSASISTSTESKSKKTKSDEQAEVVVPKKPTKKVVVEIPPLKKQKTKELEPEEKRRRSESYKSFVNRGGPDAPGSKEIPEGKPNCLKNITFVISGVLESLERDECKQLIVKHGGRVTTAISGKTNYLVTGRDASAGKLTRANELKLKVLTEDDLLEMIRTRPGDEDEKEDKPRPARSSSRMKKTTSTSSSSTTPKKIVDPPKPSTSDDPTLLWVDKYKPRSITDLIGQQGEKSPVQKLIVWLRDWYKHHSRSDEKVKAKPTFGFIRNEDPAMFKAALLSGPPGIGKTTAAQLVCEYLNFEYIEKNASNQRSKKAMLSISSDSYSLGSTSSMMSKHVLIMDEVDGVAGNEDRGGIQELIALIKRSRIPIICICNDRQHKKIRSLANYCYDLRFHRPTVQQIRSSMLKILHQENISNIKQENLDEIILSCNQDIRQTIHSLNLWTIQGNPNEKQAAKMIEKNVNNNPFELCRLSFSSEFRSKSLAEKSEIFFYDYQLMPLLIQENYLNSQPHLSSSDRSKRQITTIEHLSLISSAAESISLGDICSQMIFSRNESWALLPYQGIFSTVAPSSYVRGHLRGPVTFSSFFGQRSRTTKNERLLNEIEKHVSLKISSANKQQFNLDYLPYLSRKLIAPLKQLPTDQGIEKCISLLDDYHLSRDDFQTMMELNTWGKTSRNPYEQLDTQIKSSLTRIYNKTNHRTPYATIDMKKLKRSRDLIDDDDEEEAEEEESQENPLENDAMIKLSSKRTPKKRRMK